MDLAKHAGVVGLRISSRSFGREHIRRRVRVTLPAARLYNPPYGHTASAPRPTSRRSLLAASRRIFLDSPAKLRAAILYGSSLGPSFRPDSDIDVAILDETDHRLSWQEQARLMDLGEAAWRIDTVWP
jgi:predicted nucleotidyltransferase